MGPVAMRYGLFGAGLMLLAVSPAAAQDIFGVGRSPEQIFASDCSSCHKTPQGLAKHSGIFGLRGFLREHYTISSQTASVLARYLEAQSAPAAAAPRRPRQNRRTTAKPAETKPADAKPADAKAEAKPESRPESKPEPKPEAKPEPKPEAKPEAPKLPE